jgi:hypothetical protein
MQISADGVTQVVEHLPSKYEALSSSPSTTEKSKLKTKKKCKLVQPLWKLVWRFFKKTENRSTIRFNYILFTQMNQSVYNRDVCIPMVIMALFTIAKLWHQLWHQSKD